MLWGAVMRAMPALFVIYVVEACAALILALPSGLRAVADGPQGHDAIAMTQWLETVVAWVPIAESLGVAGLVVTGIVALLSPWLQMAWLSALAQPESVGTSLARGARLWLRACAVTLIVALGVGLGSLPWWLAGWGLERALPSVSQVRLHDSALAACALTALPWLYVGYVWHDLARARALALGPWRAALGSLGSALRPAVLLDAALWTTLGWALIGASQWYAGSVNRPLFQVALLQSAILLRLVVRGRWLARALACADETR